MERDRRRRKGDLVERECGVGVSGGAAALSLGPIGSGGWVVLVLYVTVLRTCR
ncbi:uncharacterized protein ASPGLDRAFT_44309 [Aspergillus glaucus CBS 516.65]|uniref:Uncharacterized protein n=1 Tax=Aspergillus glaucus CBS 516.65 TaxID=1160497 RepID=A0A1L9VRE6_ASPGL|nr:hypothetical protein ASPGLDRAFT_44309 [Aspergillus glaucus CBS 516.65]OJJ86508.1 hypothetical protein ASPGLDRAFT_44309 [Aspergillus glaucus CBS 516.65]